MKKNELYVNSWVSFDPAKLVRFLNESLYDPEEKISLGSPNHACPIMPGRQSTQRIRRIQLHQTNKRKFGYYGSDRDRILGELHLERGTLNLTEDETAKEYYELAILRIIKPLNLREYRIPESKLKVATTWNSLDDITTKREDYVPIFGPLSKKKSLEYAIPTAWFLKQ